MNPLWRKLAIALTLVLLGASALFLSRKDLGKVIETDVSKLLPNDASNESRIVRSLVTEKQGRGIYILIDTTDLNQQEKAEVDQLICDRLGQSQIVESIHPVDQSIFDELFVYVSTNQLHLLFPKWVKQKKNNYQSLDNPPNGFENWAATQAVEEFEEFLESPEAMQLSEEGLIDPLLLNITALKSFALDTAGNSLSGQRSQLKYWLSLNVSPLEVTAQQTFETLIKETQKSLRDAANPTLETQYGGLLKLAAASRKRIQSDVFRINILSLIGVILVVAIFIRRPWHFLKTFPIIIFALVGSFTSCVALFGSLHIIVLVIGSIVIGISIDYAFHTVFENKESKSTRKLLLFACLSTISGALTFLSSSLPLIRQIGTFTAAGLLFAFIYSLTLKRDDSENAKFKGSTIPRGTTVVAKIVLVISLPLAIYGLVRISWVDDIQNMEAADPELIHQDMELRKQFAQSNDEKTFLVYGDSFLQVLQRCADFTEDRNSFSLSNTLSTYDDTRSLLSQPFDKVRFFETLDRNFENAGYDPLVFDSFFQSAYEFASASQSIENFEQKVAQLASHLKGPFAGLIDSDENLYWTIVRINGPIDSVKPEHISELSNLEFINNSLNRYRTSLTWFGLASVGIVATLILAFFGPKSGLKIILVPGLSVLISLGIAILVFEHLNLFHLAGCFLAMALSLDYALFSFDALERRQPIPFSVWLSAATTASSFLALNASSIPVVRSLGFVVCLNTAMTIVLLLVISTRFKQTVP